MAVTPHANGSAAITHLPADPETLSLSASQAEVYTATPNTTAPAAEDAWTTVGRRPSAVGKDPRAAMAAVRARLQVTCAVNNNAGRLKISSQLP
jgi:hypothetical protein